MLVRSCTQEHIICKYVYPKGSVAMLTSIQSAGVAPEVNLRITQARKQARDPPEVQNRGVSVPTKRIYVLQKFYLKKSQIICSNTQKSCKEIRANN